MVRDETESIRIITFCFSGGSKSNHWILNSQAFFKKNIDLVNLNIFCQSKGVIISYNSHHQELKIIMLLPVHPKNPQEKYINTIVKCLSEGGIIIYPTDTVYGFGCDIFHPKAVERICRIKKIDPSKANLSFICHDLSDLSRYAKSVPTSTFRLLKSHIPGPFTFILPASKEVPKIIRSRKDTIGLRVPDNVIAQEIIKTLGHPILSSSLPGDMVEEYTDPETIYEIFGKQVDIVVDGGTGGMEYSTIIDLTSDEPIVTRQGMGEL
jgi:tRNA threonylcarbamoyl adenosine modification protein (Sua5/YciO/YrdC/YwlC family)